MKRVVGRDFLTTILKEAAPADLRIVGRMLLHAAIVGLAAGLMGAAFFAALEVVQRLILEDLGGYRPLRAHGETFLPELTGAPHFRPWLLALLLGLVAAVVGAALGVPHLRARRREIVPVRPPAAPAPTGPPREVYP